jgi:serine/threonine-protein kinase
MLGQVFLGKYTVVRQLDEGGMSRIYLARQTDPARDVVLKVLKETQLVQAKAREHFRREIHIMSRFQHPNAVTYYDSAPTSRHGPVLVMEYLRGIDLCMLLHRDGRLPPDRAGRLLLQLCAVLGAAHAAGIVHRDVKPGNLMILHPGTPQETLKLMDFGLAKMSSMLYISPEELVDWTLPAASGTPEYISPEQVRGSDVDGRADLYSVGVVLFEMLTGRRPFERFTVKELLRAHAEDAPPSFAEMGLTNRVSCALEAVVRACLAKNPDQRPKDPADLAALYQQALGHKLTLVRPSGVFANLTTTPSPAGTLNPVGLSKSGSAAKKTSFADRHAVQHRMEARMPEALAMLKLKGFIHDLGGEVIESIPGMIRVRLPDPNDEEKKPKTRGLLSFLKKRSRQLKTLGATMTDLEMRMERPNPTEVNRLAITLTMRSTNGIITAEWRNRCQKIGWDLQAYLMGRY